MKNKTKEQLIKEIENLRQRITEVETVDTERKKAEEELKAANQQLQASEQQLRAANQQLDASNQQLMANEQEREKMLHDMGERVKELQCLYGTTTSIQDRATAAEVFHEVAALIPPAWNYPEITRGRIFFNGKEYVSEPFKESKWKQSSDIVLAGKRRGSVDVFYMEKRPELDEGPFLKEERHLIDTIARTLSESIERKQAEDTLKAANQQLQASEQQLKAFNQQLIASEQQLRAANQQLDASNQQLRASEQEIRKMEENWRESFNSLEDIMILIDRDFNIEKINANGLKLLGKSEKAVLGKKCYEIIHGVNVPSEECPLKKSLETGKVESLERFEKNFGRYFSIKISPIFDEKGNIVRFVDLLRDITERKHAEEELKKEKEYTQNIIGSSLDMIISVDKDRNIIEFNNAACETFGYTKEEVIGKHVNILYADEEEGRKVSSHVLKKGTFKGEVQNIRKNGKEFTSFLSAAILQDENGEIIGTVGNSRDITDRKKAEKALKERNKELNGLYKLGKLASKNISLENTFIKFSKEIVPQSMRFSDKVHVGLQLDGRDYITCHEHKPGNIPYNLSAPIIIEGKERGKLIIGYLEDLPFTEEFEQKLVNGYAERLGKIIERKKHEKQDKIRFGLYGKIAAGAKSEELRDYLASTGERD